MRPASFADTLYALGHWLMSEDRPGDAAHVYRAMLTTVPADERGWLGLAGAHELRGEDDVADGLYRLAETAVPSSYRAALGRARLLRRREAESGLDEAYERAVDRARAVGEDEHARAIEDEWRLA